MRIGRMINDIQQGRLQRLLSGLAAVAAAVTGLEVYLEHDRASFGSPWMWLPVVLTPPMSLAGIAGAVSRRAARTVLPAVSSFVVANGLQGAYLHARGILAKPGGSSQVRYNVEMGPPPLAPLLVMFVGGMGLVAALLPREGRR